MEDLLTEPTTAIEQEIIETPVTTKKRKAMAQTNTLQETNGQAIALESKPKRERKVGLLPSSANEQTEVQYTGKIIEETNWAQLKSRQLFSVNPNGSHPYLKVSKSSFVDLITEETTTGVPLNSNQKVYRVKLL